MSTTSTIATPCFSLSLALKPQIVGDQDKKEALLKKNLRRCMVKKSLCVTSDRLL